MSLDPLAKHDEKIQATTVAEFHRIFHEIRTELAKVVVGQDQVIEHLLVAIFSAGHVLLTGLPGLGRTLAVKTLATVLGLEFRRIQFTPDLLPSDIVGTEVLEHNVSTGERHFHFFKGPVFANLILVDEINRSPARTQAAMLEVMQERQVTAGGQTYFLPRPFQLIATENSLDSEGIWTLGEAQIDRFMMSVEQHYPTESEERRIVHLTTGTHSGEAAQAATPEMVLSMQALVRQVPVVPSVKDFALAIVRSSRPGEEGAAEGLEDSVRLGASPRAAQSLILGGKVTALARGRTHVSRQDIIDVARPVMAHRVLLDVRAQAEGHDFDELMDRLISDAQTKTMPKVSRWTRELLRSSKVR